MSAGERSLRDCLGQFASGVTVVTTRRGGRVHGATVSSFTSVSLSPPLVMVSLDRRSRLSSLLADQPFGINVLAAHQSDLALRFAGRGEPAGRDAGVAWLGGGAAPRLAGAVAHFSCAPWASYDGGDHLLYVGEVLGFDAPGGEPLVFHGGAFRELRGRAPAAGAWTRTVDGPAGGAWDPAAVEALGAG